MKRNQHYIILLNILMLTILITFGLGSCQNPCSEIECLNEGTCIDGVCTCLNGFSGNNCEIEDFCITKNIVCENEGVCENGKCECIEGFSGNNCEIEDLCITQNVICENEGICEDGSCVCAEGYTGVNCEAFDPAKVQFLLNSGITPFMLYNGGIQLDNLYGKNYKDGLIFYLDTTNGTGLIAATSDQSNGTYWGCGGLGISGLKSVKNKPDMSGIETEEGARIGDGKTNTETILAACSADEMAAKLCRELGSDWFLPSRGELNLMYSNLFEKDFGNFTNTNYWTSTQSNSKFAWKQFFALDRAFQYEDLKESLNSVRAVRCF